MKNYDVIVIGTGAANIVTDAALAQGLQVAVIERDPRREPHRRLG